MRFTIKDFEGPLDLLLHLIKSNKMDIYNIDIHLITTEYLRITENSDLSIDESSEYILMASELIHLKSKSLIYKEEEYDDEYEFNSHEDLTNRLLEYQRYKSVAGDFRLLEEKRKEVFTKMPSRLDEYRENKESFNSDVSLDNLLDAFSLFLEREKLNKPINTKITRKELSVEEKSESIRESLRKKQGKIKFLELFEEISKPYVVVTFLSILNMAKDGEIKITQENNFSDIFVEKSE